MSVFEPLAFTHLMNPEILLLLGGVAILLVAEMSARAPGVMHISTGETLAQIQGGHGLRRRLPALLRAAGLALLILALARPVRGLEARTDQAEVVDVMLCVDLSGSMKAVEVGPDGQPLTRLDMAKLAVLDFIENRKARAEDRFGRDRLGLVFYAAYAWSQCPLTLDYVILEHELKRAEVDETDRRKQGTAIGSALGLAVGKLRKSEAKTKVVVLLTDGINNSGELDPITAAGLAKEYGIRVYTIGAGSQGTVLVPSSLFNNAYSPQQLPIDEETLTRVAEITGGKFFRATDLPSLAAAYEEINRLERTEIEVPDYYDYEEGFMPYAVAGAGLLLASLLGRRLWFDPIP